MQTRPLNSRQPAWFKSSYSGGNATECVETAFVPSGVLVRDSKQQTSPSLTVSPAAWSFFVAGVCHICTSDARRRAVGD
ncbi:DUF397 domain-containing protein [Streptomyces sp. NPDC001123]